MKFKKEIFVITMISMALCIFPIYSQGKAKQKPKTGYTQYVDPYIGSGGHGHVFVGANVQLGPATIFEGWDWCSGYNYSSNTILGFTHTHLSGTGIGDLNDILLLPASGKVPLVKAEKKDPSGYGSTFSHKNEV